jgi:hypothetical protein
MSAESWTALAVRAFLSPSVPAVLLASALPKLTLDEAVDELERSLDSCLNNVSADFHSRKPGITERSISRLQMERQRHLQEVRLIVERVLQLGRNHFAGRMALLPWWPLTNNRRRTPSRLSERAMSMQTAANVSGSMVIVPAKPVW